MVQELVINVIPFSTPIKEAEFAFYTKRIEGYCPIHKDDLSDTFKGVLNENQFHEGKWLYTDFEPAKEGAKVAKINLENKIYFSQHYYRHLIRKYFSTVADVMRSNFTNEVEVWFKDAQKSTGTYNLYNQYTIKVQHSKLTQGPELVLSFDGTTKVLAKPISKIYDFKTELYNWVNCDGKLYRWKFLPQEYKTKLDKCFPVLSNTLKPHFDVAFDVPSFQNRYPKYLNLLSDFYSKYLNTLAFKEIIPLADEGFFKIPDKLIRLISPASNELLYSNGKTGKEPKKDFKFKGPYQLPRKPSNFKFFFIYKASDKTGAVRELYNYLKNGYKHEKFPFPNIQDYIKIPFQLDISKNIEFDTVENAASAVRNSVKNADWLPDTLYMALFVNPVPKTDKDEERNGIYYKIKETLLYEGVLSQVIKSEHLYKDNKPNPYFNTFLPHIEIAMLAKLGGVPWRLNRPTNNELIVGVGAFYSVTRRSRFVGSAFCFNNEGIFKGFDCFRGDDTISLAGSIREAVGKFIVTNHTASRLIIHFYKDISKKELEPILKTLHTLGLNIPVIVVTINKTESKELLAFDILDGQNLMPFSGSIVKVAKSEYLLFNNTRYSDVSKPNAKEYHFPVKIALTCTVKGLLEDMNLVEQLIDQVYQFSRMYWKSTNQQSLPVTIKYPEMVAEIYPYFQHEKLPDFGRESLWFL